MSKSRKVKLPLPFKFTRKTLREKFYNFLEISYRYMTIRNLNIVQILDNSGRFVVQVPFNIQAKMAVVRQLTYTSSNATPALYKLNWSLSYDTVGTVSNTLTFVSNPMTRIPLNNPNSSYIEFRLVSPMLPIGSEATDIIGIDIDFYSQESLALL